MRGDAFFVRVAASRPFTRLHPAVSAVLKDYLASEKVVRFGGGWVVNTSFPPYPSPAFDHLVEQFAAIGEGTGSQLYSVTLAVTNRCRFNCWHCYNAGRREEDLPFATLAATCADLQAHGAVVVTLTGGEPLLRPDLEAIAGSFDRRTSVVVGTTGDGLTAARASGLRAAGVFGVGISLDSAVEEEHDRMRNRPGAFRVALDALRVVREQGLYPYVVAVATREFLEPVRFYPFLRFAAGAGALEVHLLEPSATGRLEGRADVLLTARERRAILRYQRDVASDESLPIVSSFTHLESGDAFGCGAGLTHLYIDGAGEVSPCNLVPLSFGNIGQESLGAILSRMRRHFVRPRTACAGRTLAAHLPPGPRPTPPELSSDICRRFLPVTHPVPRFFKVRSEASGDVGLGDLQAAYDEVHGSYDDAWLSGAAAPIEALIDAVAWSGSERVFEAGCGTGYATALLARRAGSIVAVDLSDGMLAEARRRLAMPGPRRAAVRFQAGDALRLLEEAAAEGVGQPFDLVCSTWVLGYIPLRPFFRAARRSLRIGGRLALVVHKDRSPRVPLDLFAELVAQDPSVLQKRVAFDFPRDRAHLADVLDEAGFAITCLREGAVTFRFTRPQDVLGHLLRSGAGTAFYNAIDPLRRAGLTAEFLRRLEDQAPAPGGYEVPHEYFACVAVTTCGK